MDVKGFSEETREASPANFLIKIVSFSLLSVYEIAKYECRPFEAGGYKWKLIISFEENESGIKGGHVSVYFSIAETDSFPVDWEINAIFTFFLHNHLLDNYLCFRGTTRRFNAVNPKWGLSQLISKRDFIDPSKGYVVNDSCVFGAEVFVITRQRVNECLSLIKDASSYKRDWKISNFSKLGDFWYSEEFVVGDHNWKVKLYPKGSLKAKDRYVSIFVHCISSKEFHPHHKVKADLRIRIKSKLDDTLHSRRYDPIWFTQDCQSHGSVEFIPIADMTNRGFLVHDCCILEIEITLQALALDAPKI